MWRTASAHQCCTYQESFSRDLDPKIEKSEHLSVKLPTVRVRQQGNWDWIPGYGKDCSCFYKNRTGCDDHPNFYLKITERPALCVKRTAARSRPIISHQFQSEEFEDQYFHFPLPPHGLGLRSAQGQHFGLSWFLKLYNSLSLCSVSLCQMSKQDHLLQCQTALKSVMAISKTCGFKTFKSWNHMYPSSSTK